MIFLFRKLWPGTIFILLVFRPVIIKGEEWSLAPVGTAEIFFNDNYQLETTPHRSEWGSILKPEASFMMDSENFNLSGKVKGQFTHLYMDSSLDTAEHDLTLSTTWEPTEMTDLTLSETNLTDSTLESELAETGILVLWTQRYLNTASLQYSEKLNEKVSLNEQYSYTNVYYAGNNLGLNNYVVHTVDSSIQDDLSDRLTLFADINYSYSQIQGFITIARDKGITGGSKFQFSESLKGSFSAGAHWTDTSADYFGENLKNAGSGWTLDGKLESEFQPGHALLELTRNIQISGLGSIVLVDQISMEYDRPLSERLTLSANGQISTTGPIDNSLYFPKSELLRLEGKLSWQASTDTSLSLDYNFLRVSTEGVPQAPASNAVYLMATWQPAKLSVSR
jgi:hypothetical protein